MPLPTVVVAGTVTAPDGTPLDGKTVSFETTAEMVDAAGNILYPISTITAKVVAGALKAPDGTSALTLVASDNGVTTVPYEIRESWSLRKFTVNLLTTDQVGSPLHIPYSSLGPVSPAPTATSPYALAADAVRSVVAGTNVTVDRTDPQNPVVSATGTGGGGAVDSVFGRAGAVVAQSGDYTPGQVGADPAGTSASEAARATSAENALSSAVAGKADLTGPGSTVPRNQLPNISGSFWQQVADQTAMLALTAPDADTALVVFRADTPGTVWFLNPGLNPATLGNWGSYQDDAAGAAAAAQTAAETYADRYAGSAAGTAGRPLAATDATTTDARTPTAHHTTHSTGGSDAIAPADIGADTAALRDAAIATQHTTDLGLFASAVKHGATAGTARPTSAGVVLWIGTVAPTNAAAHDVWMDETTASPLFKVYSGTVWLVSGSGAYLPLLPGITGAPTTGTHATGEVFVDNAGIIWICTSGGTPGTWAMGGAGVELAAAELSADFSLTSTTSGASAAAVTGLSVTFTAPSRSFIIDLTVPQVLLGASTQYCTIIIKDNAGTPVTVAVAIVQGGSAANSTSAAFALRARLPRTGTGAYAITPGTSYTFGVKYFMSSVAGGNGTMVTNTGVSRPILRAVSC